MDQVSVRELRKGLATVLNRVGEGERIGITRGGETIAVLLGPDEAAWAAALAERFQNRQPPFTQAALDAWLSDSLDPVSAGELLAATTREA